MGLFAVTLFGLTGCGGGGGGSSNDSNIATTNKVVSIITVIDGHNQTDTVGTDLPNPLVALIKNSEGQTIAGQTVTFKVTSGGGTVFAGTATSDTSGYVRERWTLGTIAGEQKVEVRAVDSSGTAVVFATFGATAVAGAPQAIIVVSGNGQTAQQSQPLPLPIKAIVKDKYDNPTPGVSVVFTVNPANNGGTVQPVSAITNTAGEVSATWALGLFLSARSSQTLSATVTGLTPAIFNADATQAPPAAAKTISIVSGDSQTVIQHSLLVDRNLDFVALPSGQPLVVLVTDINDNPLSGAQVTFSASPGSSYIFPQTVTTYSGYANWSGSINATVLQKINAAVTGITPVIFNINVTATNHPFDGPYGCVTSSNYHFDMEIAGGSLIYDPVDLPVAASGTLDETTGNLTAFSKSSSPADSVFARETIIGKLQVDSLQHAVGTGTSTESISSGATNTVNWTCERW